LIKIPTGISGETLERLCPLLSSPALVRHQKMSFGLHQKDVAPDPRSAIHLGRGTPLARACKRKKVLGPTINGDADNNEQQ